MNFSKYSYKDFQRSRITSRNFSGDFFFGIFFWNSFGDIFQEFILEFQRGCPIKFLQEFYKKNPLEISSRNSFGDFLTEFIRGFLPGIFPRNFVQEIFRKFAWFCPSFCRDFFQESLQRFFPQYTFLLNKCWTNSSQAKFSWSNCYSAINDTRD